MARYRSDLDEERDYYERDERFERQRPWNYNDTFWRGRSTFEYQPERRGGFGERAEHEYDEPRYGGYGYREPEYRRSPYEREHPSRRREYGPARSRVRVRDIMTRDLAVATRDTTLREIAIMMKKEDTGVIPVVDFETTEGDGKNTAENRQQRGPRNNGKLMGLLTDRDIVVRAVAEDKDCRTIRAEEIMSTDIHAARRNDRVVDVIREMGEKQVRRIPVVSDNGYLLGITSMADVAVESDADRELADALEDISKQSSFWSRIFGS